MKRFVFAALLGMIAAPVTAEDLSFKIINLSSAAMVQFFTSPADVNEWEEDVFGDGVLPSGNEVDVNIADGREQCVYDVKFVMENGQEILDTLDMCESPSYTISDK